MRVVLDWRGVAPSGGYRMSGLRHEEPVSYEPPETAGVPAERVLERTEGVGL